MQFTHIPLLTTPPPPNHLLLLSPATGLSYLRTVVYHHDPPREKKRESERDGTIGGVLFLLSGPDYLFIHLRLPLAASQGVVSGVCVCVYACINVRVDWPCLSISCVKVSRPAGSYMKEPLKSLWRTNGSLTQCSRFQDTHARRPMPHTHWLTHSFTHADTPHPQPTIHKSPSLHTPFGQA